MPTNFEYLRRQGVPIDFSAILRGAENKARGIETGTQNISEAVGESRRMSLEAQRVKLDQLFRQAQEKHYEQMEEAVRERTDVARNKSELDFEARLNKLEADKSRTHETVEGRKSVAETNAAGSMARTNARLGADKASGEAMGQALGNLQLPGAPTPDQAGAIGGKHMGALGQLLMRAIKTKQDQDALKQSTDAAQGVLDDAHAQKTIDDDQYGAFNARLKSGDVKGVMRDYGGIVKTKANAEASDGIRESAASAFEKKAEEFEKNGNPKMGADLRNEAAAIRNFHGDPKTVQAHAMASWDKILQLGQKPVAPTLNTGTSAKIPDPLGLSGGGYLDDMSRQQREYLIAAGRSQAMKDPRWKALEAEEAVVRGTATEGKLSKDAEEHLQAIETKRLGMTNQYATSMAVMNGWKHGSAPKEEAQDPAASLRARIQGGDFGHQGNWDEDAYQKALKDAGLTDEQVNPPQVPSGGPQ